MNFSNESIGSLKNDLLQWRAALSLIGIRRRKFLLILVLTIAPALLSAAYPVAIQRLVDQISHGAISGWALIYIASAISAVAALTLLSDWRARLVNDLGRFLNIRIGAKIVLTLLARPRTTSDSGKVLNILNEHSRISTFLFSSFPGLAHTILSSATALIVAMFYDYLVTSMALLIAIACGSRVTKAAHRLGLAARNDFPAQSPRQGLAAEIARNADAIKALAAEGTFFRRWRETLASSSQARWNIQDASRSFSLNMSASTHLVTMTVMISGCIRMYYGALSVGELIALQVLISQAVAPLTTISFNASQFHMATVALRQVQEFLDEDKLAEREKYPQRTFDGFDSIDVRGLRLAYPGADRPALADVSFTLPKTGVIAIVGRNGSGKTSLVRALTAMHRDYAGSVLIDGQDIRRIHPRQLRSRLGVVDQNSTLFSGAIRQNLTAGIGGDVSDERIKSALRFASAEPLIASLPNGLDHVLREGGQNLSGGQRQRLAIARAMLRDPLIAVFDEPTSALDAEAAVTLERNIAEAGKRRLVIIVTHHLFTARSADAILVLDDGVLVGHGRHADLIETCDSYSRLWNDYTRETAPVAAPAPA